MRGGKIIKVCGMRDGENILSVEALGVDLMGFIFYPKSPRYVDTLPTTLPSTARRVGVFVDEQLQEIERIAKQFGLDYAQLHGSESPQFCASIAQLGLKVIKAFSVDESFDFASTAPYEPWCDMFVFDTKCSSYGGSGKQFDWSILDNYSGTVPFLLSGGIAADSAEALKSFNHPKAMGYDLNSRFEISPAVKDTELLKHFLEQLK